MNGRSIIFKRRKKVFDIFKTYLLTGARESGGILKVFIQILSRAQQDSLIRITKNYRII